MDDAQSMIRLAVALAVGVLIGLERGSQRHQDRPDMRLIAGIRTFALIGLAGGLIGLFADQSGPLISAAGIVVIAGLMMAARLAQPDTDRGVGLTTVMAGVVAFVLGLLAAHGQLLLAAAGGVVTALVLNLKSDLHGFVARIERTELAAFLRLLAISIVILPILPDEGMGPWGVLNPFELWLMVVLIAGLSFLGYVLVRIVGARRGVPAAALAGGLVSSTAVSLSLARAAKSSPASSPVFAAGIVLANTVIFPRVMLVTSAIAPDLAARLIGPMAGGLLAGGLASAFLLVRSGRAEGEEASASSTPFILSNPLDLRMAIQFSLVLGLVILSVEAVRRFIGEQAIWGLSALSGLTDVDAITLSLARGSQDGVALGIAGVGIVIACASNSLVKWGLVLWAGPRTMRRPVSLSMAFMLVGLAVGAVLAESFVSN